MRGDKYCVCDIFSSCTYKLKNALREEKISEMIVISDTGDRRHATESPFTHQSAAA